MDVRMVQIGHMFMRMFQTLMRVFVAVLAMYGERVHVVVVPVLMIMAVGMRTGS